jgi:hypothetical protein
MSESPGDLAVAFRSFGRRLDEALAPSKKDPALAGAGSPSARELATELGAVVAAAAREVHGVSAVGDVRTTGAAVADAIAAIPPDAWDDARLERLRSLALEGGRLLRQIEQAIGRAGS